MNGITNESNEAYHSSAGLSFTGLKLFAKTPRHLALREDKSETSSQRLGTLAHMALLEPACFESMVKIVDGSRNANAVKAQIAEAEAGGFYVCKSDEYEEAAKIRAGAFESPTVRSLLSGGVAEQTIRAAHPIHGFEMKCRPDYLVQSKGIVVDLKTFGDLSIDNIERQIAKMKYHWQSYWYLKTIEYALGIKTTNFVHVFIDTECYSARAVVLDDAALDRAGEEIAPLLEQYTQCLKNNEWPGYPNDIENVTLPAYAW